MPRKKPAIKGLTQGMFVCIVTENGSSSWGLFDRIQSILGAKFIVLDRSAFDSHITFGTEELPINGLEFFIKSWEVTEIHTFDSADLPRYVKTRSKYLQNGTIKNKVREFG